MASQDLLARARHLLRQGQAGAALQALSRALELADGTHARAAVLAPLAQLFAEITPRGYHPRLDSDLLACLEAPGIDPQPLARTAAALLLLKHPALDIDAAAGDPLWTAFLTRCINTHPAMEARLIAMRDALLYLGDPAHPLLPALALQAFANEYAWPEVRAEGAFAVLARPLIELDLAVPDTGPWPLLARRTRAELATERAIAPALPSLGASTNPVSAAVQAQYEANPYPRWQAPPASDPRDLRAFFAAIPGVDAAALPAWLDVLVAGCGTGYEAIDLAGTAPDLSITALDLSRASLAYAARKAEELDIANIAFVQGDILDLDRVEPRFGLVNSTGVLHHVEDPAAGLAAIARVLEPGGLARIALYSRRARAPVRAARALIAERGWAADACGIRTLRQHIVALPPSDPLAMLAQSDDFYTLSGCRDLLFHVHEHGFSLPEIGALVKGAGLRLAALDTSPEARALYGAGDPLDLERWDRVEAERPFLFAGMVPFLCQKPI